MTYRHAQNQDFIKIKLILSFLSIDFFIHQLFENWNLVVILHLTLFRFYCLDVIDDSLYYVFTEVM